MESVAGQASGEGTCDGCLKASSNLTISAGDRLCEKCRAVFLAAAVLLNEGITSEDTLIPTLVFAKVAGGSSGYGVLAREGKPEAGLGIVELMYEARGKPVRGMEREYAGWELLRCVRGVPILRVLPLVAKAETHPGTHVLKNVRIQVLSRRIKPVAVREEYERLLAEHHVRWNENNHGVISYRTSRGFLEVEVSLGWDVSPHLAEGVGDDLFSWPVYNFPPPVLVADIYRNLLGSVDKRNQQGFAYMLDLYGKPQPKTAKRIISAFAAWHIGQGESLRVPPKSRPRVARVLNRQLLDPAEHLPDNSWSSADKVWSDVEELATRFVRLYAMGGSPFLTRS